MRSAGGPSSARRMRARSPGVTGTTTCGSSVVPVSAPGEVGQSGVWPAPAAAAAGPASIPAASRNARARRALTLRMAESPRGAGCRLKKEQVTYHGSRDADSGHCGQHGLDARPGVAIEGDQRPQVQVDVLARVRRSDRVDGGPELILSGRRDLLARDEAVVVLDAERVG